jgi:thiazole synthase ThiGH ThiG subunit
MSPTQQTVTADSKHAPTCAVCTAACRRCNASDEHEQQLASALQVLQQEVAELHAQLARAEDNQQAAAAQMSQVLSINRNLQVRRHAVNCCRVTPLYIVQLLPQHSGCGNDARAGSINACSPHPAASQRHGVQQAKSNDTIAQ